MEKIELKSGKKLDLGRSWARCGEGLGRCGASFGRSWATLGQFWRVQNRAFFQHGPKMGSKRPSGQIWAGFGEVWDRFWEGWERCSTALLLHLISCAYCLFSIGIHFATVNRGIPALTRYAPRSVTKLFLAAPISPKAPNRVMRLSAPTPRSLMC